MPWTQARFTVVHEDQGAVTTSAIWTLKIHRGNVYLWARPLGGIFKVSLHGDRWRVGFTTEYAQRDDSIVPDDEDRAVHKWMRPPARADGTTRCITIRVPPAAVSVPLTGDLGRTTGVPDSPPRYVAFPVVLSPLGQAVEIDQRGTELPGSVAWLPLNDTERITVLCTYVPPMTGRPPPVSRQLGDLTLLESARNPRAILIGDEPDGSPYLLEAAVEVPPGTAEPSA